MNSKLSQKELDMFNALHEERKLDARTFSKPDYRGIWSGVVDKYKEKAHFVYELLQNADDAQATEATFELERNHLIFRHNGTVQFTVSSINETKKKGHINAITGVGNSTKNDKNGNTIGKFGVGFKAVFQYTDEPRIYDDKFWFKIENFIIPTALSEDYEGRKKGETLFDFPFSSPKESYNEIVDRLKHLNNPILFLRHLKQVKIEIPQSDTIVYKKEILETHTHRDSDITHELMLIRNNGTVDKVHMFTQEVTITDENQKESIHYISVGYFLKKNGELDDNTERKVFCFFPTAESFKLKCVVHAPFLLVDSRQQLKDTNLNNELKSLLADLAADALVLLRDYGKKQGNLLINENIFKFIPAKEYSYRSDNKFRDAYIAKIQTEKLLLGRGNKYIDSNCAVICHPISMMQVINDQQLEYLKRDDEEDETKWRFLREETQKLSSQYYVKDLLDELDVCSFDGKDFASCITEDFMEKQGFKWAKRLYAHLRNEQVGLWKRTAAGAKKKIEETPFCLSPIILTSTDTWTAPYLKSGALNVYLPLSTDVDGYNFSSSEYDKDKECKAFLLDLGLKEPDAWDYIQSVILKRHANENNFETSELNDDLELVYDYFSKLKNEKEKEEKINTLSEHFLLIDTDGDCFTASELYDDSEFLKHYFNSGENFIGYKKYKRFIDKFSIQDFKELIFKLGVSQFPKVYVTERYSVTYEEQRNYNIPKHTWCHFKDYYVDGFGEWKPTNIVDSKLFWEWLSEKYILNKFKETQLRYQYYSYYTKTIPTKLLNDIKNKKWVVLHDGRKVKPVELSLEDLEESEYKIDYELIKIFGIEKKTKSLKELGASTTQIEQNELGKTAAALGLDTEEKLQEALQALNEKRERENSQNSHKQKTLDDIDHGQSSDSRNKMRKTDLDEMSSSDKDYNHQTPRGERNTEDKVNDIKQKLEDEANRKIEEENKRAEVDSLTKYSKIWFDTLLELEYSSSSTDYEGSKNGVRIVFERFRKESGSDKVYVLSNPSRNIPIWVEDLGGITVKFTFFNRDDISFTFEVANVKDFTLRVKAKSSDVALIDKIDWSKCNKAVIETTSPVEIMYRLRNAFKSLPFDDNYNFKENLNDNLSFVFGPPGTGKTTRLAEIIKNKMTREKCKILVLTPTNKACDVLTKRLMELSKEGYSWLGRFVATGEESIESSGVLIDRTSDLWQHDTCCIISTIARFPYDGFTQFEESGLLKDIEWDFIIIDEASMIPLVQIVYALYKQPLSKFIVAGDPLQIAPIVREKGWLGENIYTMVELDNFDSPHTQPIQFDVEKLGTQYRSIPSIGTLYSNYCYDGKLKHKRAESEMKKLPMGNIPAKAVTFVPFRVERFDSIFGAKKLQGSNVHIYSALFAVETCAYIARQQVEPIKIGVICPYAPQAQLINKMIEQRTDIPEFVEVAVGTIHGFQGDQCEIIITVFNPPTGIKVAADRIMLNNRNIINVAISRASDYLIVLLPHPDSYGYENLIEINKLCSIAKQKVKSVTVLNSDQIEKGMFANSHYVEDNTFVTTHQLANVYTSAASLYEVRIDDNAVDIQVSSDKYQTSSQEHGGTLSRTEINNTVVSSDEMDTIMQSSSSMEENSNELQDDDLVKTLSDAIERTRKFEDPEQYFNFFKAFSIDLPEALEILVTANTECAIFAMIKIIGDPDVCVQFGWKAIEKTDIKALKDISNKYNLSKAVYPLLFVVLSEKRCCIKKIGDILVEHLDYQRFRIAFSNFLDKQSKPKVKKYLSSGGYLASSHKYQSKKDDNMYEKFEYGLSDW